ncbi:efflux RND transporter permease subunit [Paenibacillus xylanexedens]|uniref:efflux RND transporter permease subunit n=1 Tax=Paenibacillus xylanexedens TaxID=528191 RepID=UPI0011A66D39|nr:efflux RND transporter permease subunit [Paenibacillus xylanexedens]
MNATDPATNKIGKVPYVIAILFISFMVGLSEILQHSEIILPEVAAMAIAMWVYREPGWIRHPTVIFIAPTVTATIGLVINQLQILYPIKIVLTLMIMMLFLRLIRSNLAPAIATGLLPLAIHTEDWSFVWIVLGFTLTLMAGVVVFQLHKNLATKSMIQYKYMVIFPVISICWLSICWLLGYEQVAVIPPIFVVLYESLQKPMYTAKIVFKQAFTLTLSAAVGVLIFTQVDSQVLAAAINMIVVALISRFFHARIPALYAIPLLTFIFPEEKVWSLPLVTLFASLFMFSFVLLYKYGEKRTLNNK